MIVRLSIAAAILVLAAAPARADTLQVPGDASTIQAAIVAAADGDTILVGPGTYVESIDFLGKQLVIESTGGAAVTTIDAAGDGSVVTVNSGEPDGTALRGFTITGGTGQDVELPSGMGTFDARCGGGVYVGPFAHLELADCVVTGNDVTPAPNSRGGGLAAHGAIITVTGCSFTANTADRGAAVCIPAGGTTIVMTGCDISGNTPTTATGSSVYLWEGLGGSVTDCVVHDNVGRGLHHIGYGVSVTRCTFYGNSEYGYGHYGNFGADVIDLTFLGNGVGGAECGGSLFEGIEIVRGCVFANGDKLAVAANPSTVDDCSFDAATIAHGSRTVTLRNCIVRGAGSFTGSGPVLGTYSDIEGGLAGTGNIDADPQWMNAAANDYRLLPASPCIDAGDPGSPLDPDGTRADMGAVKFENAFDDLGGGVAGTAGPVVLAAHSTLVGGDGVVFELSGTTPFQSTVMILGASALGAPFKGGTLWPALNLLVPGLMTNGSGQLTLSATWPTSIPPGFQLWAQFWHSDPGAIYGFAGSNGVHGTVP